jgi:hypothetical protein
MAWRCLAPVMTSAQDISRGMVQFMPETVPKDLGDFRNIARSWCVYGQRDVPGRPRHGPAPDEHIVSIFVHRKKLGAFRLLATTAQQLGFRRVRSMVASPLGSRGIDGNWPRVFVQRASYRSIRAVVDGRLFGAVRANVLGQVTRRSSWAVRTEKGEP